MLLPKNDINLWIKEFTQFQPPFQNKLMLFGNFEDPLLSLLQLSTSPEFIPTEKITREQLKILKINPNSFLWPEEEKLFIMAFTNNKKAVAFKDAERGTLQRDYFSDYIMPVVEHVPWTNSHIPIPPALTDDVIALIRKKIKTGVFEPSQASY
jgi:hypothetical protein